jgi:hypothetical protein
LAKILPSDWRALEVSGAAQRELETLAVLERALDGEYTVIHGVHWTRLEHGFSVIGEIDFVILNRAGRVLLVEQKSGFLKESDEGLVKTYGNGEKSVAVQMGRARENLMRRLGPLMTELPSLEQLLYCPDYRVKNVGTAGVPPERLVDASRRDELAARIRAILPPETPRPELARKLVAFFSDQLQLVPDVGRLLDRAEQEVTRLAGGLATWARALDFSPFRLRVVGTAGSGKTQLALQVLNDAATAGRRALYVCYNRPLADHLSHVAPSAAMVCTYHQLADRSLRAAGRRIDYSGPEAFAALEAQFATLEPVPGETFDEIVVDEGQDFDPAWRDSLLARLAPQGRAWWLEDPMQNLYLRPAVDLPGWVTLHADVNYRSPRQVLAALEQLGVPERPIVPGSPIGAGAFEFSAYDDVPGLLDATKRAVTLALAAGLRKEDIVVLSYSGRGRSRLLPFDKLGPHTLRRFTGSYDMFGTPEYTDGDLLVETVYRFKGQSAPCIVFTEIDFDVFDERARRKLFVGMTRAGLRLHMVLSRAAEACLTGRLSSEDA